MLKEFAEIIEGKKGMDYRIYNGWDFRNKKEVDRKMETCIAGGKIEAVEHNEYGMEITLENNDNKETFSAGKIEKVFYNKNEAYIVYRDHSYFRITFN